MSKQKPIAVITQSGERGEALTARLRDLHIASLHIPLIETVVYSADRILAQMANLPESVDGWLLTSATASRVFRSFYLSHPDWKWGKPICYCIGETTASELRAVGLDARCYEDVRNAEGLADQLIRGDGRKTRQYVFFRGAKARGVLPLRLRRAGHGVSEVVVYETAGRSLNDAESWRNREILWVLFSPSGVQSLMASLPDLRLLVEGRKHYVVAFGRTTEKALAASGVDVISVPNETTHEALIAAIRSWLEQFREE
ncbi:uroporphyrinogen-III synthase [Alicyclobacillus dauci]|uniref:Uroporphyrinogen-III synthase n=1 Tax=Alicyclobacillus dauci TaxID=1475485 RepID=A0ABY6Z826_9BACL|nr:uroporphyrinogen-III synthase [Alicyclobacillus dauci]WAH38949.1 uroporphyrinogen-III synthase [Alicyclobacillus dauci]